MLGDSSMGWMVKCRSDLSHLGSWNRSRSTRKTLVLGTGRERVSNGRGRSSGGFPLRVVRAASMGRVRSRSRLGSSVRARLRDRFPDSAHADAHTPLKGRTPMVDFRNRDESRSP